MLLLSFQKETLHGVATWRIIQYYHLLPDSGLENLEQNYQHRIQYVAVVIPHRISSMDMEEQTQIFSYQSQPPQQGTTSES